MRTARAITRRNRRWAALVAAVALLALQGTFTIRDASGQAAPTVDGNLDAAYGGFASINYTRDQGGQFSGAISVIETADAYYVGFQQSFATKSNSYCQKKGSLPGCFQQFNQLVGSDYISFEWDIGGRTIYVPVDILRSTNNASGYASFVGGGDGGSLDGIDAAAVQGKSSMDYNLNVLGWADFANSPNFAGQPNAPYVYPSIAELRLDKAGGQLANGLDLKNPVVVVHNSPQAPLQPFRFIHIDCPPGGALANVGQTVTVTVTVTENGLPAANQPVLALATGVGNVVSVGGTAGNRGTTGNNGTADVVVTSNTAGTTQIRAVLDLNNDGVWDQATEPATEPTCPVTWGQPPGITVDVVKTNDADQDGTFTDDELAPNEDADVDFKAVIHNTSSVPVVITVVTDVYAGVALFPVCANVIGTTLAPDGQNGDRVTCNFTVQDYAPAAGDALDDTVSATVAEVANPTNTATDQDDSRVRSPAPPPGITVDVVKTNDGDGDETFTDFEEAPAEGAAVPFRARITNTSSVPVVITVVTDVYPGVSAFDVCADVIGTTLAPFGQQGDSTTCNFTLQNYAPAADDTLTNTVSATVAEVGNPTNTATDDDDSTVTTPAVLSAINVRVVKTNDADRDDAFADDEEAPREGASVRFKAVISNLSRVPVVITDVTDVYPGVDAFDVCGDLIGTTLAAKGDPGDSVSCFFTVDDYAPAPNDSIVDTVEARVCEVGDDDNCAGDDDDSTVRSPEVLRQKEERLAFTGLEAGPLAAYAMILALTGAHVLIWARRRERGEAI